MLRLRCSEESNSLSTWELFSNGAPSKVCVRSQRCQPVNLVCMLILLKNHQVESEQGQYGTSWAQLPKERVLPACAPCLCCGSWHKCGSLLFKFKLNTYRPGVSSGCSSTPHESLATFLGRGRHPKCKDSGLCSKALLDTCDLLGV